MKKRILSGLLALVLVLGLTPNLVAAAASENEAAQVLAALDIMVGDQSGNLNLGGTVTRAEFTKLVMAASPQRKNVGDAASVSPYPDVPRSHWAAPYIQAAVQGGYVTGYLDGTFRPGNTITLAEGVTMVLRLLGYQNSDFGGAYPAGQMAAYHNLKLDTGISTGQNGAMTRRDAMYLFYNLMTAKTIDGLSYYLNTLEPGLVNAKGEIDMVALVNTAMEGPVVAESGWQSAVPFNVSGAKVYRSGVASSLSAIQPLDVVYYSKSMHTLWAYSNQVVGTYESADPSSSSPTSITVAGKPYAIESSSAAFDLSDLGPYRVGDGITLLLGRDGGVAAVRGAGAASSQEVYGMVTLAETKTYTDSKGGAYDSYSITLLATDGSQPTYAVTNRSFRAGDLVRVSQGENGAQVKRLSTNSLTGRMNADGTRLGNYTLASNVQILDTYEKGGTALRVYPSRLAGIDFKNTMVRFYALNTQGEISHLVLDDVTGDLHHYGILTSILETDIPGAMAVSGAYTYDVKGVQTTWNTGNSILNVKTGPCQIKGALPAPEKLLNLKDVKLDRVDGNVGTSTDNRKYTIAEDVAVYVVENTSTGTNYNYSSLSRVSDGSYTLFGYYDKAESEGGRIRVILAR